MNSVKTKITNRVVAEAFLMVSKNLTIREVADIMEVSKSTVHQDLTKRLPEANPRLSKSVCSILAANKAARHIRGGQSTKQKYELARLG